MTQTVLQPLYVIPMLIDQPTWGGGYIANLKQLDHPELDGIKIGQSYELARDSLLTPAAGQAVSLATASTTDQSTAINHPEQVTTMAKLVADDPEGVLGPAATGQTEMPLLIKFTQAQSNSYQLHVKPGQEFGSWQAKPESWYFLEPGAATLGLRPDCEVAAYRARCEQIDAKAGQLSQAVERGELGVAAARQQLESYINADHPSRFVNQLKIDTDSVIDLSGGGIHHSWETHPDLPDGNIVYELQLDVRDDVATLRSFDQGKMKNDGSVRPLTIDEYFSAIDTDPERNRPDSHMRVGSTRTDGAATITTLFDTPHYRLFKMVLNGVYQGEFTSTQQSFQHVFVSQGEVKVIARPGEYPLTQGWSVFIPSGIGSYRLEAEASTQLLVSSL